MIPISGPVSSGPVIVTMIGVDGFDIQGVDMLRIHCVVISGRLVGKSVSDRWNLAMIGYGADKASSTQVAARRLAGALDCQIVVHKADQTIQAKPSKAERESLGRKLVRLFSIAA